MVNAYQLFLLSVLVLWPVAIFGLLWLMSRLENYVRKLDAHSPAEAGLEPVAGQPTEREVKIIFGDTVVGDNQSSS
jgi:hypothetical protein